MSNGILDAIAKHGIFSETLDVLNRDPSTAHQMKGYDFAQNFPGVARTIGPGLARGYQTIQELSRAAFDPNVSFSQGLVEAKRQADANIQGMKGFGFNMADYQQNLQDFGIPGVTFSEGLSPGLSGYGFDKAVADVVSRQSPMADFDFNTARALENRAALDRAGIAALDDAGLVTPAYENFAQVARPGFNLGFAKQLGRQALTGILSAVNPVVGLIARGLSGMPGRVGIQGGVGLRGDTTFDTFGRSTSLADFAQRMRDKRAREDAARRGALKELQSRIDKGDFGKEDTTKDTSGAIGGAPGGGADAANY